MPILTQLMDWLKTCPGMPEDITADHGADADGLPLSLPLHVPEGGRAAVFPKGVTLLSRAEDITGGVTETLLAVFTLRLLFPQTGGDGEAARRNAEWLLAFQDWTRDQSARGLTPRFGNHGVTAVTASGGTASGALPMSLSSVGGPGGYTVKLTARYQHKTT